ncbi:MAG: class I SAM-dependent methyltransferase, partial [Candidatus Omnitrophota bacterium]
FSVIGIDISEKQIQLAKQNVKGAEFKVGDMAELKKGEYKVDAIIAFYSIFHIPRKKHKQLLKTLASFLPKGGLILITMGATSWQGTDEFFGHQMWWSHYGAEKNRKIINQVGFEVIFDEVDKSGEEKHLIILARKK